MHDEQKITPLNTWVLANPLPPLEKCAQIGHENLYHKAENKKKIFNLPDKEIPTKKRLHAVT